MWLKDAKKTRKGRPTRREEEPKPSDKTKTFLKKKEIEMAKGFETYQAKRANNAKSNFCRCFLSSPAPIVIPFFIALLGILAVF
jgi:hypothetical protein